LVVDEEREERKKEIKESIRHSIKQTEEEGPCDSPNPALICFAQALMPTVRGLIDESDTPLAGLIAAIAEAVAQGISLGKHSGGWALLAREELKTSLRAMGFENQQYSGEEEEAMRAYFMAHPLSHTNPEQDNDMEVGQIERAHLQEVDAAYEAGGVASE